MNYFVYILFSESLNMFYIGQTNNLEQRIIRHNKGYEKFTKKGIPWRLEHSVLLASRSEAMKLEKKLKNLKSQERIINWIQKNKIVGSE